MPLAGRHPSANPGGYERAHGAYNCSVRILRRFSHPFVCWPKGVNIPLRDDGTMGRDTFDCEDHVSVTVAGECAGIFQCSNGSITPCQAIRLAKGERRAQRCTCTGDPNAEKLSVRVNRNCTNATAEELTRLPRHFKLGQLAGNTTLLQRDRRSSRMIWIFWAQGWDVAKLPRIVNACAWSWQRTNPHWHVHRISAANLHRYRVDEALATYTVLPHVHHFAFSDILRTELLGLYGGLWVDATAYCTTPIESWIPASVLHASHRANSNTGGGFFSIRYTVNGPDE